MKKNSKINDKSMEEKKSEEKEKKISNKSKSLKKRARNGTKLTQADIKKYSMNELDHVILKIKANEVKYTIISVLIILLVFFLVSYIIFSSVQERISHNVLKNGNLYIEFQTRENGLGDIIDLVDVDTDDSSKDVLDTYKVTITNDSSEERKYQVFIVDDVDMIKVDGCHDIFLDRSFLMYNINDGVEMSLSDDSEKSVIFGTLGGKKSVTYTIKVWVSDTYLENPHYHGKIVVKQVNEEKDQE